MEEKKTLEEQVEEKKTPERKKFGTFAGVFTPTLLTILGVIMFLREGWVVGNAGLLGAFIIITMAFGITAFTGLSMSSITTNIRIGAGGAFSIISQSLGLEVGGSVGIPLYLSQALAAAMYIFGFRAGWRYIFPNHPAIVVDVVTFIILFVIAFISANLAFRVQYFIMAIIGASLVSIIGAFFTETTQYSVTWWGKFPGAPETNFQGTNFWAVFAVFFPAATGIMAGANLSGELKEPRKSIPIGTMSAIGLSFVFYIIIAYWLARVATTDELISNYTIMIDRALWGPPVLAGLLGATFSSGLSSIVGAPRILQALGERDILPAGNWLSKLSKSGEPQNAMLVTGIIIFGALMLRNLNAIAPLITMFFLVAYTMINVVVFIEQSLGLISFRPLFKIHRIVPVLGAAGCLFAMFIVNPTFSLIAIAVVLVFHGILIRRHLQAPFEDVRSGLFVSVAEWAAKRVADLSTSQERAWKPNIMIPVENPNELRGIFKFVNNIAYPKGSVKLIGLKSKNKEQRLSARLPVLTRAFREEGVFASWTMIEADEFGSGVLSGIQALSGTFFRPNIVMLKLPLEEDKKREEEINAIIDNSRENRIGILLLGENPEAKLGREQRINLWVREHSPEWRISMELGNLDLGILIAYKLKRNWHSFLNFVAAVPDAEEVAKAEEYLNQLTESARIPDADVNVHHGDFETTLSQVAQADLNIFDLPDEPDFSLLRHLIEKTNSTCIFTRDSGEENALA